MTKTDNGYLFLSDDALDQLGLACADVADAIETAILAKANGQLHTAPKSAILPGDNRYMMSTLAVGDDGFVVVKQVSVCPENSSRGLATINGAIMVLDAHTGLLRAVVGANWVTAMRTAALSAVAARRMADPHSETLALVGTGVQAHSHLKAFAEIFPLKHVRAFGRSPANVEKLCQSARDMGLQAEPCLTAEHALRGADLVVSSVTLDYSIAPFLDARWLKSNAFAAITDLCIPWHEDAMGSFSRVIIDDLEQEAASPKPMMSPERISSDLTALVAGSAIEKPKEGPSAFAFRGMALGDYAAAVLAVRRAEEMGIGTRFG